MRINFFIKLSLEIERFIDREYYEVLPQFVIQNAENIISEITADFN